MDTKDVDTAGTAPAKPAAPVSAKKETPAKARKKGGCLKSCLTFFLVLILALGALALLLFRVPQKMGWIKGPGATLVTRTPERTTAEDVLAEATANGFKAEGVRVFVFPKPDTDEALLYASYDFSKDARLSDDGKHQQVYGTLVLLAGGEEVKDENITHVGAEFLDEEGKFLMEVSASTEDVRALKEGRITEDEFRRRMAVRLDIPNYVNRAVIPF